MDKHRYDKYYILFTVIILVALAVLVWFNN
jgi:hypothetical protein